MDRSLESVLRNLEEHINTFRSLIVAFSGGVDSSVVAAVAYRALGANALAVTAVSPALAFGELDGARSVAKAIGIAHEVISTNELARLGYQLNGPDRCYHCKSELYDQLAALASARRFDSVASGANADDLGDWRPGLRAAAEHSVCHPLIDCGIGKVTVRQLAQTLGLPSASKPASPCLSSRIPHGTPVDLKTLQLVDAAERSARELGYADLRVRHFGERARIELGVDDLQRVLEQDGQDALIKAVAAVGYTVVDLATEPMVSGSLTRQFLIPAPSVPVSVHITVGPRRL